METLHAVKAEARPAALALKAAKNMRNGSAVRYTPAALPSLKELRAPPPRPQRGKPPPRLARWNGSALLPKEIAMTFPVARKQGFGGATSHTSAHSIQ